MPTTRRTWPRRRCRSWPAGPTTAGYGPPFNQTTGASQEFIGIKPAEIAKAIFGLTLPINTANNFVLAPVSQLAAPSNPAVAAAVSLYKAAGGDLSPGAPGDQVASSRQMTWLNNYAKALSGPQREGHAHLDHGAGGQLRAGPGRSSRLSWPLRTTEAWMATSRAASSS